MNRPPGLKVGDRGEQVPLLKLDHQVGHEGARHIAPVGTYRTVGTVLEQAAIGQYAMAPRAGEEPIRPHLEGPACKRSA